MLISFVLPIQSFCLLACLLDCLFVLVFYFWWFLGSASLAHKKIYAFEITDKLVESVRKVCSEDIKYPMLEVSRNIAQFDVEYYACVFKTNTIHSFARNMTFEKMTPPQICRAI